MTRRLGLALVLALGSLVPATACERGTGALTAEQQRQLEQEGIVRRADDVTFRYTHDAGRRDAGWEDRRASIIVTRERVFIHKTDKRALVLSARARRFVQVRRDGSRVRISVGSGGSAESWSFEPPEDPAGWAADIRSVVSVKRS